MMGSDVMGKMARFFFLFEFSGASSFIQGDLARKAQIARFAAPWAGVHVKVLVDIYIASVSQ